MVAEAREQIRLVAGPDPCDRRCPRSGSAVRRGARPRDPFLRQRSRVPARTARSRDRGLRTASCAHRRRVRRFRPRRSSGSAPAGAARRTCRPTWSASGCAGMTRPSWIAASTLAGSPLIRIVRRAIRTASACPDGRRRAASSRRSTAINRSTSTRGGPRSAQPREPLLNSASSASRARERDVGIQQPRQLGGSAADADLFRSRDIDDRRRRRRVRQRRQRHGVGVPLPDRIEVSHRHIDGLAPRHASGQIDEHAVPHLRRVVQPQDGDGDTDRVAEVLEDAFAREAAHGVLADGSRTIFLARAGAATARESVDVPGREHDDSAAAISRADERGKMRVHGPRERFVAGRSELPAGHEDDVRRVGQPRDRGFVEQIAADRLDAVRFQRRRWSGDEKRETPMTRCRRPAASIARLAIRAKRGPHLAGDAEHDHVAVRLAHRFDRRIRGFAQQLFEMRDIAYRSGHFHGRLL